MQRLLSPKELTTTDMFLSPKVTIYWVTVDQHVSFFTAKTLATGEYCLDNKQNVTKHCL